jgi:hypothetical protein
MQLYFQNNFVKLSFEKLLQIGIAEWKGRLQGAELREAYLLCHEMINRYALTKWLADDRLMGSISPADLKWSLEVHVPQLAKGSLQRIARLPSKFEKNREAVEIMINKGYTYDLNLVFRDFYEKQEAMEWLLEPSETTVPQNRFAT